MCGGRSLAHLAKIAAGNADQLRHCQAARQMFVQMHTALDRYLAAAATQNGVTLPEALTPEQQLAPSVQA